MANLNPNQFRPLSDKSLPLPAKTKNWSEYKVGAVRHNYKQGFLQTPEHLLRAGAEFYPTWHEDAQHLSDAAGVPLANTVAMIAHLSPSNEAEMNRIQGFQMVHDMIHNDRGFHAALGMAEHARRAQSARSRMQAVERQGGAGSRQHRVLGAELKNHQMALQVLRDQSGVEGTPLGHIGARELSNAAHALIHADPMSTLSSVKIGDFGHQILDPWGARRMTMDTHFHDAGVGRLDIPYKPEREMRGLTAIGRYEGLQGHAEAARISTSKQMGREIAPHEFMGGVWYGHQQRKATANPYATKARKASASKLARVLATPQFAHFLPATHGRPDAIQRIAI